MEIDNRPYRDEGPDATFQVLSPEGVIHEFDSADGLPELDPTERGWWKDFFEWVEVLFGRDDNND